MTYDKKVKICKHLDGDLSYCLMIKGKCPGKHGEYCQDYEEWPEDLFDKAIIDRATLNRWGILKCYLLFWKYQAVYLDRKLIAFINIRELMK